MIDIHGVSWNHDELTDFLNAIPYGTVVEFRGSTFYELRGFPMDGWPHLELSFVASIFLGATD